MDIREAAEALKRGGVVAFPTETVYGLGASVFLEHAIEKIFRVKGRPQDNPLIVHIAHLDQLSLIVEELPPIFSLLAKNFFPGPLTLLLPKKECVPGIVSAHLPTIGVRMPAHPLALQLIDAVGVPLVAPSANLSGKPSSTTAQHVLEDFGDAIEGVVDGGACHFGIESTVLALLPTLQILRPGAITQEQLEKVVGHSVPYADEHTERPLSPGMKYRHYSPRAKVIFFESKPVFEAYLRTNERPRKVLSLIKAEELYAIFRRADEEAVEEIVIFCDSATLNNRALMNRIRRASQ